MGRYRPPLSGGIKGVRLTPDSRRVENGDFVIVSRIWTHAGPGNGPNLGTHAGHPKTKIFSGEGV